MFASTSQIFSAFLRWVEWWCRLACMILWGFGGIITLAWVRYGRMSIVLHLIHRIVRIRRSLRGCWMSGITGKFIDHLDSEGFVWVNFWICYFWRHCYKFYGNRWRGVRVVRVLWTGHSSYSPDNIFPLPYLFYRQIDQDLHSSIRSSVSSSWSYHSPY